MQLGGERTSKIKVFATSFISIPEIAEKLVISDKTVRNHITNIFTKLQVADRTQAILKARDAGLANN